MTIADIRPPAIATTWEDHAPVDPVRRSWAHRLLRNEIHALTLVALTGYVAAAFWVRFGLHFFINDALNRSADAIYVTVGRDPHLAAIGFYWPPLAQIVQLPIAPIATRFGEGIMTGPISSAICMALTIPVLARIGHTAGLRRRTTFVVCAVFALNPVVIYYAAIGMSEACFFLFGALAMLGFLRYCQQSSTPNILLFSAGLCGVIMTRLEGPFLTFALVVVATFELRHLRRSVWNAVLIAGPPYAMFGLWILVQWILLKDPFFFQHQQGGAPPKVGSTAYLPNTAQHPLSAFSWAGHWVLVLGPAIILVALFVVVRPGSGRIRGCVGIVGGACVFLAIQIDQVISGTGFGNPRYFVTCVLFATVGVLWIASSPPRLSSSNLRSTYGGAWNVALIAVLVVGAVTGSRTLTSGLTTHVEGECAFFEYGPAQVLPFLGGSQSGSAACARPVDAMRPWKLADRYLDATVKPSDRILADNSVNFPADLFTTKPQLFIVENDRDWQKTVANPRNVTYVVTQSATPKGPPAGTNSDLGTSDQGALIVGLTPAEWRLVGTFPSAKSVSGQQTNVQVYHFVPKVPGDVPQGAESGISS